MNWTYERNPDLRSGVAVKEAQAWLYRALKDSQVSDADLQALVKHDIHSLLTDEELTIGLVGRVLAICGYEFNMDIQPIPVKPARPAATVNRAEESLKGVSGPPKGPVFALPLAA